MIFVTKNVYELVPCMVREWLPNTVNTLSNTKLNLFNW